MTNCKQYINIQSNDTNDTNNTNYIILMIIIVIVFESKPIAHSQHKFLKEKKKKKQQMDFYTPQRKQFITHYTIFYMQKGTLIINPLYLSSTFEQQFDMYVKAVCLVSKFCYESFGNAIFIQLALFIFFDIYQLHLLLSSQHIEY